MIVTTKNDTFADYLRLIAPSMPPALISAGAFNTIMEAAAALPGSLAMSAFGFECKLGEKEATADFQLQAAAASNARRSIRELESTSPGLLESPIWQRLRNFAVEWGDPQSSLYLPLYNLWLEFDLEAPLMQPPVPSVFFGLQTEVPGNKEATAAETEEYLASLPKVALHALGLLQSKPVPEAVGKALTRCMRALPANARVGFVGAMLPRNIEAVRLIINGLGRETIPAYLEEIKWPGSTRDLALALEVTASLSDYIWLNVDVGDSVYPKVSWECYLNRPGRNLYDASRWRVFLDLLVAQGLCIPEKADALLQFPAILLSEENIDLWPASLKLLSRLLGPHTFRQLIKGIHHVKVVYQTGKPLEAKAYLYARYE